jgi:hypothetical protein
MAALDDVVPLPRVGRERGVDGRLPVAAPRARAAAAARAHRRGVPEGRRHLGVRVGHRPGWAVDLLPLVLSGVAGRIDEIRCREIFNYATYDQPHAVRNLIGFGRSLDETPPMLLPMALDLIWARWRA